MKLLVMSDSHRNKDAIFNLIEKYKEYTPIHLGDFCIDKKEMDKHNIIYVCGNCDRAQDVKIQVIEDLPHRIMITHGDLFNVKFELNRLYYKTLESDCDFVFFGHTHMQGSFEIGGITFLNPGALQDGHYALYEDGKITLY